MVSGFLPGSTNDPEDLTTRLWSVYFRSRASKRAPLKAPQCENGQFLVTANTRGREMTRLQSATI